jgi:hypothetical protein
LRILLNFFRDPTSPGLLVYSEYIAANVPEDRETLATINAETEIAYNLVTRIFPPPEFYVLAGAIDDSTSQETPLVEDYLSTLENARIPLSDPLVLNFLPPGAFSGAYNRNAKFVISAAEPLGKISPIHRALLHAYLDSRFNALRSSKSLWGKYPHTLKG